MDVKAKLNSLIEEVATLSNTIEQRVSIYESLEKRVPLISEEDYYFSVLAVTSLEDALFSLKYALEVFSKVSDCVEF